MTSWEDIEKKRQEWARRNKIKPLKREYSIPPEGLNRNRAASLCRKRNMTGVTKPQF